MKKIVVLDGKTLGEVNFNLLNEFGKIEYYETSTKEEAMDRIRDAHIVLTNKVVLNEEVLKNANNLEIICETATGYNNIDIDYAKKNNIAVTNVAGYSTTSVAQHTFATVLALYDKISHFDNFVKSLEYSNSGLFTDLSVSYDELEGKTWGIVGLGAIGRRVAKIAEAFGINVIYYSTSGNHNDEHYKRVELDELLLESDIISIHAPLNEKTKGLFNIDNISKMKSTAILVNMGRGSIIVEEDLAKAIDENIIAGSALDVFEVEPIDKNNPLLNVKNKDKLILTPHIAWASTNARQRLFNDVIENIRAFYSNESKNRIC